MQEHRIYSYIISTCGASNPQKNPICKWHISNFLPMSEFTYHVSIVRSHTLSSFPFNLPFPITCTHKYPPKLAQQTFARRSTYESYAGEEKNTSIQMRNESESGLDCTQWYRNFPPIHIRAMCWIGWWCFFFFLRSSLSSLTEPFRMLISFALGPAWYLQNTCVVCRTQCFDLKFDGGIYIEKCSRNHRKHSHTHTHTNRKPCRHLSITLLGCVLIANFALDNRRPNANNFRGHYVPACWQHHQHHHRFASTLADRSSNHHSTPTDSADILINTPIARLQSDIRQFGWKSLAVHWLQTLHIAAAAAAARRK